MIDDIKKLRQARRALEDSLAARLNALRAREAQLARARRRGKGGAEEAAAAEREIAALREAIERDRSSRQGMSRRESDLVGSFVLQQTPQQLASQLDDRLPCLLFPLRIETRFMRSPTGIELWVRVYPDDIAVHTHEEALTRDEAEAGLRYWTERAVAAAIDDAAERERVERGAWRSLVNSAGGPRASWIASELRRRARAKEGDDRFAFLLFRVQVAEILAQPDATPSDQASAIAAILTAIHPLIDSVRSAITALLAADPQLGDDTPRAILSTLDDAALTYLDFDLGALKAESWSRPPRTEILPDRFVLIGFAHGVRREFPFPNPVPTPLILGPDPQKGESELVQRDGDLLVGEDYAWIWDFERAIAMGMAMRTPLPSPFERGFDRLLVLGLRVSESAADHAALLEALIDNHHYAPEGMGFLAQGSPTNHTAEVRSAVSSDDADGDASFDVETTEPEVPPPGDDLDRTDAQRLAEAWDVDVRTLLGLRDAGVRDVAEAKVMNRALWPATLGFFLEELLEVEPAAIDRLRSWFTAHVVARGSLPAIHVGKQPYGVLLTSAFRKWRIDEAVDGEDAPFQRRIHEVLTRIEDQWQALVGRVSTVDSPGDSFAHLLNMLGLHPTSVDFARRIGTQRTLIWNLAHMIVGANFTATDPHVRYFQQVSARGLAVMEALGFSFPRPPRLFGLLFSDGTSPLNGPLVDDVATAEDEQFSETVGLPAKYTLTIGGEVQEPARNYIGWLVASELNTLKQQDFRDANGNALPIPLALLYRMLHRALLLASHDATMKLYEEIRRVSRSVRVEGDFTNVEAGRTVTRWEFMEARVNEVMPEVSGAALAVGDFLSTREGLERPVARFLAEVRDAIGRLEGLPTARLERLFAEHVDLCSYRLDAWQTSLFAARLERLNALRQDPIEPGGVKRGVHIGAYGWLENVRPGPLPKVVSPDEIPNDLQEPGVDVVEQPNNGGYIHGPSINHAAAAAVLRNAYLTHARQDNAEHFAVKVTSERVRTALAFLDGIRNGQELGALLGYQFERALHDRYVIDGKALAQFILAFRTRFPLVADKVTPDPAQDSIQHKEAYQVVDGYALLEAVFLQQPPLAYPFGVVGLPLDPADGARQAIIAEVERLRDTLDAISDLALAEGVFQVSQGNHERAGAMLKAISEGNAPPEPEIVNTPRGGAVVNHRVALHFDTGAVASPWSTPPTPRSVAAPGLNKWLGDLIGGEDSIQFSVGYDLDGTTTAVPVAALELQPIDLVSLIGDEAGAIEGTRPVNDLTELELRIDRAYRLARKATDPGFDPSGRTTIEFMSRAGFTSGDAHTFFETLPLLRTLRNLVTSSRPLGADDYLLPSEASTDPGAGGNPKRWDLQTMRQALDEAAGTLKDELDALQPLIAAIPAGALNEDPAQVPDLSGVDYDGLRDALKRLANFGLPGAFPKRAILPEPTTDPTVASALALLRARQSVIEQAVLTHALGARRHAQAGTVSTFSEPLGVEEQAARYQQAAALILGDAFRLLPTFAFANGPELEAARAFALGSSPDDGLLRFTQQRLRAGAVSSAVSDWRGLAVEEWMQGVAAVRGRMRLLDQVQTYREAFASAPLPFQPLQLPFDERAHWITLEFPEVTPDKLDDPASFVPAGDFLSIVRHLPAGHDAGSAQVGLVLDEWNEVIPNRIETTGIALHYNQPNTEPPQCLLLALSPTIKGAWEWDDLVDTLVDTFDRAKRRAVEPDFLRDTPFAQLLPAVISSFTSFPFGTISTNLAAQPASMVVDGGA